MLINCKNKGYNLLNYNYLQGLKHLIKTTFIVLCSFNRHLKFICRLIKFTLSSHENYRASDHGHKQGSCAVI